MRPRDLALLALLGSVALLAVPHTAEGQCVYACEFRNGCHYCVEGASQEECHVACRVCWGYHCGPEPESGEPGNVQSISSLTTVPAPLLERNFETAVGEILSSVWSGFNGTPSHRADPLLDIKGKVLIDGSSHDFRLRIAQVRGVQNYFLEVTDYGRLDLSLKRGAERVTGDYAWVGHDGANATSSLSFTIPEPEARVVVRHSTN